MKHFESDALQYSYGGGGLWGLGVHRPPSVSIKTMTYIDHVHPALL